MSALGHVLAEPWGSAIGRRALVEIVLLGAAGGALGCWVVLADLSYGAESMAHALLPGLVLAALAGVPLLAGAAAGLLVAAAGVAAVAALPGLDRDTAVAVVITPLLGLGALLALAPATPAGLGGLLFGDVLGVDDGDLRAAALLCAGLVVALRTGHARLLAVGFDRAGARALGVSAARTDLGLLVLMAVTLLVAVQAFGNLLVVAVLVAPAVTARALTVRVAPMLAVAAAVAVAGGIAGLYASFYASTAAGASVVAVLVVAALAAQGVTPRSRRTSRAG